MLGDLVELNGYGGLAATTGARATVERFTISNTTIQIQWDKSDPRHNGQNNGGYSASSFDLVSRAGKLSENSSVKQSSVVGECTCPKEVWLFAGCKCGAIVPYKPKP